mmetsp:Transcript_87952/g.142348  ORF Transcript_87952/g.142348 Transcript_87952/m.142348 type:complete len:102 (+) Transcript_87952:295-600(+)
MQLDAPQTHHYTLQFGVDVCVRTCVSVYEREKEKEREMPAMSRPTSLSSLFCETVPQNKVSFDKRTLSASRSHTIPHTCTCVYAICKYANTHRYWFRERAA